MLNDSIILKGALKIVVRDITGAVTDEREVPNLVVAVGKNFIASRMIGTSDAVMSHMAIGEGTTSPASGNTTLESEVGRVALTSNVRTDNAIAYTASFPAGTGTGAITEAGLFNANSSGTMLCRTTFPVINKGSADSVAITWTVSVN
jgi:flagellar basal body rod protein FlgG